MSFWRYRFPTKRMVPVDAELVISLFTDFLLSVGLTADEVNAAKT